MHARACNNNDNNYMTPKLVISVLQYDANVLVIAMLVAVRQMQEQQHEIRQTIEIE